MQSFKEGGVIVASTTYQYSQFSSFMDKAGFASSWSLEVSCGHLDFSRGNYIYIYILLLTLFHYGLSQTTEYSSLHYTVGPCCLSI